jgi:uncharacterized protein
MTAAAAPNLPETIQARPTAGRVVPVGPWLVLAARPALALLTQGGMLLLFAQLKVSNTPITVRNWWTVYGTLVDLGCLGLLVWLTRREGLRPRDLLAFAPSKLKRDVALGVGIFAVVFPLCVLGGGMLAGLAAYGNANPVLPEAAFIRSLPFFAVLYSRLLWWPLWSLTEELTYNGYALPRLKAMTRSAPLAIAAVSFFWSLQHSFLPWINPQHGLYLFLMFVPLTVVLQLIYLRVGRLTPLVIGHWLMDLTSVLFMLQVA